MSTTAYIVIAVVVVLAVIVIAVIANQRKSSRLQNTFGSEYGRTVEQTGDRRQAERELAGRVERRKQFNIIDLSEQARQQYLAQWQRVQAAFVDAPAESVRQADALVSQVMTDRGYPVAEFEQRAADVSVDHPSVVENYRSAHAIALASGQGQANTEALRQAMTQYRALFDDLLGVPGRLADDAAAAATPPPAGTTRCATVGAGDAHRGFGFVPMTESIASPGLTTEQLAEAGDTAPPSTDQGGRAPMTATADRAQPAADASTDVTILGEPARGAGASQPLLANGAAFTSRWTEIQTMFVDEPRTAVEQADTLVAEVIRELARVFAEERGQLESAWSRGTDVSTEDLRQALQRYRDFFHVLLRS